MKKRLIMALMIGVMTLTYAMPAFAAPKQMADGNVFDAEYYATNNSDVVAVVGAKEATLYKHYVEYGKREGRIPYADALKTKFDAQYYAANNPDVVAIYGTKAEDLYKHYLDCGKAEGRLPYEGAKVPVNPLAGATVIYSYESMGDLISEYSNGMWTSKVVKANSIWEPEYWILRTDFSDGLLDEDGNGIDDRDPYNDCGYTDLNHNAIVDGAPHYPGYCSEEESTPIWFCDHGVLNGTWICQHEECKQFRAWMRTVRSKAE